MGPWGASYQAKKNTFSQLPSLYYIISLKKGLSFSSFLQFQEELEPGLTIQKHIFFSKIALTKAIQRDPGSLNKSHVCLAMLALFRTLRSFKPRLPSVLGWQTFLHLTFAPKAEPKLHSKGKSNIIFPRIWSFLYVAEKLKTSSLSYY